MCRFKIKILAVAAILAFTLRSSLEIPESIAAPTASGTAKITVIQAISITKVSDLDFLTVAQGAPTEVIAPGTAETAQNASFDVTGNPGSAFSIQLPTTSINMTNAGGGTIAVSSFTSNPATSSTIPTTGNPPKRTIFVGATRAAVSASATPGAYTGTFSVTVVYQ